MVKNIFLGFCLALTFVIEACSGDPFSSTPSEADAQKVVEEYQKDAFNRTRPHWPELKVLSLKKSDGLSAEEFGVKVYKLEFKVKYEVITASATLGMKKGQILDRSGSVTFVKSERGWRPRHLDAGEGLRW